MTFIENLILKGFIDDDLNKNLLMNEYDYVVRLLTYCAKSDKKISAKERDFIINYIESIDTNSDRKTILFAQYDYARFNNYNIVDILFLRNALFKFNSIDNNQIKRPLHILYELLSVCLIDSDNLNSKNKIILKDYLNIFNLSDLTFDKIFNQVLFNKKINLKKSKNKKDDLDEYYEILGLNKNCTKEDLKKRYAFLSKNFHPDKYNFKYIPYEIRKELEDTYKKINFAYDKLKVKF